MENLSSTIYETGKNGEHFFKILNRIRAFTFSTFIQCRVSSHSQSNRQGKEIKTDTETSEVKPSVSADGMNMLRVFNRKALDLTGLRSKVSEHKIYTQRSAAFLRANNTFSEKETRETHQSQ